MVEPENPLLGINRQCELLDISRSGYYYEPKPITQAGLQLLNRADEIYTKYPFYGARRMACCLQREGYQIGRKKVRSVYETLGLEAIYQKPKLSRSNPEHTKYPYLLDNLEIIQRDQVWSTDITYIRLCGGYIYLMAIIDWFSRYVLDWEISITLEADFCVETLSRVLRGGVCEIFNTDQGTQFTCHDFTNILLQNKIKISMDGKGRCLDNIFVERLWRSVKYECIYIVSLQTVKEAREAIKKYFTFYNYERPHQALKYKTPAEIYFADKK